MRCPHCEKPIKQTQITFTYPLSKVTAHFDCVSQPSVKEMDTYLLASKRSNTRRVYTDKVQFGVRTTQTGRMAFGEGYER
jgi:hypothetical protein